MHVDGHSVINLKSKNYEIVFEFHEIYWHDKYYIKKRDLLKQIILNEKGKILIVLTDEQDPNLFEHFIADQFEEKTGVSIKHLVSQTTIDHFVGKKNNQ